MISLCDKGKIISLGYIADLSRARELLEEHKVEIRKIIDKYNVNDSDLVNGTKILHDMVMQENARLLRLDFRSMRVTVSGEGRTRRILRRRKSHRQKSHRRKSHRRLNRMNIS